MSPSSSVPRTMSWSWPRVEVAEEAELDAEDLGEEVGDLVVGCGLAGEGPAQALSVVRRVRPVLDQAAVAGDGVVESRQVADREHAGSGGAELLVDEDGAALERELGSGEVRRRREDADADDRKLRVDRPAALRRDVLQPCARPGSAVGTSPRMTSTPRSR